MKGKNISIVVEDDKKGESEDSGGMNDGECEVRGHDSERTIKEGRESEYRE